jgi:hypothetical protein
VEPLMMIGTLMTTKHQHQHFIQIMMMMMMDDALLLLSCVSGGAIQIVPLQMALSNGGGSGHVDVVDDGDGDWAGMIVLCGCWLLDDVDSMELLVITIDDEGDDGVAVQSMQFRLIFWPQIVTGVQQNTPGSK